MRCMHVYVHVTCTRESTIHSTSTLTRKGKHIISNQIDKMESKPALAHMRDMCVPSLDSIISVCCCILMCLYVLGMCGGSKSSMVVDRLAVIVCVCEFAKSGAWDGRPHPDKTERKQT